MATAFAEQERRDRGLEGEVEIRTGGTHPAASIHDVVIDAMAEEGFDLSSRTPREITIAELESCEYVVTMGCSTLDLDTDDTTVDVRDWALDDPDGKQLDEVREIRGELHRRVRALFQEIEQEVAQRV